MFSCLTKLFYCYFNKKEKDKNAFDNMHGLYSSYSEESSRRVHIPHPHNKVMKILKTQQKRSASEGTIT